MLKVRDGRYGLVGAGFSPHINPAKSSGLKRVCENRKVRDLVPQGRLNLAQDASPGLDLKGRPSPAGTAENGPRFNPPSAVPAGLNS
jgi:hypothetical protein